MLQKFVYIKFINFVYYCESKKKKRKIGISKNSKRENRQISWDKKKKRKIGQKEAKLVTIHVTLLASFSGCKVGLGGKVQGEGEKGGGRKGGARGGGEGRGRQELIGKKTVDKSTG